MQLFGYKHCLKADLSLLSGRLSVLVVVATGYGWEYTNGKSFSLNLDAIYFFILFTKSPHSVRKAFASIWIGKIFCYLKACKFQTIHWTIDASVNKTARPLIGCCFLSIKPGDIEKHLVPFSICPIKLSNLPGFNQPFLPVEVRDILQKPSKTKACKTSDNSKQDFPLCFFLK